MKKSRFTEEQIIFALKQAELGTSVPNVCRTGYFRCHVLYMAQEIRRDFALRTETHASAGRGKLRLKKLLAYLSLDKAMLQDVLAKKT